MIFGSDGCEGILEREVILVVNIRENNLVGLYGESEKAQMDYWGFCLFQSLTFAIGLWPF